MLSLRYLGIWALVDRSAALWGDAFRSHFLRQRPGHI